MYVSDQLEVIRTQLRAMEFERLNDAEVAWLRERYATAAHNNSIEGVNPTPELAALFDLFLEERVPVSVSDPIILRYFAEA